MLDYEAIAKDRLSGQFSDSPKLNAVMAAIVAPLGMAENDADTLVTARWIETAEGAQLDGVGSIVGEMRLGRDDATYREAIKFRIFVNTSGATRSDLISALHFLTAPTDAQYQDSYPATALLFTNGFFVNRTIQPAMQDLAPVGLSVVPVAVSFADLPLRFGKTTPLGELFVNGTDDYLTANGADIQVTNAAAQSTGATLGGVVPAELDVGGFYLDVGGPTLAIYSPEHLNTIGHYNLTGVFQ